MVGGLDIEDMNRLREAAAKALGFIKAMRVVAPGAAPVQREKCVDDLDDALARTSRYYSVEEK